MHQPSDKPALEVFGLDFTSSPSRTKRLTLARCKLEGNQLVVLELESLNTETDGDMSGVGQWLAKGFDGIAGIDFPFGLPLSAIEHFNWNAGESQVTWSTVLDRVYSTCPTLTEFQDKVETWKRLNKKNDQVKVHVKRHTDQLTGSSASSPLKVRDNPAVGSMFYAGARLLRDSGACIWPVRINDDKRHLVEAYPALVVNRCVGDTKYKDAKSDKKGAAETTRLQILGALSDPNAYGIQVSFSRDALRDECRADHSGDKLDSVLCATQAAWASRNNCGMPKFSLDCLQDTVAIEGWIADPILYEPFTQRARRET